MLLLNKKWDFFKWVFKSGILENYGHIESYKINFNDFEDEISTDCTFFFEYFMQFLCG